MWSSDIHCSIQLFDSCLEAGTAKRLLHTNVMMELAVPFFFTPKGQTLPYFLINATFLFCSLYIFGSVAVMCVAISFSLLNLFYIKCHSACQTRLFGCNFGCCSCLMTEGGFGSPLALLSSQSQGFVMVCFELG